MSCTLVFLRAGVQLPQSVVTGQTQASLPLPVTGGVFRETGAHISRRRPGPRVPHWPWGSVNMAIQAVPRIWHAGRMIVLDLALWRRRCVRGWTGVWRVRGWGKGAGSGHGKSLVGTVTVEGLDLPDDSHCKNAPYR